MPQARELAESALALLPRLQSLVDDVGDCGRVDLTRRFPNPRSKLGASSWNEADEDESSMQSDAPSDGGASTGPSTGASTGAADAELAEVVAVVAVVAVGRSAGTRGDSKMGSPIFGN